MTIEKTIEATFTKTTARWNGNNFVNREEESEIKDIKMSILEREYGKVLKFEGGPTGHESYYIDDLLGNNNPVNKERDYFCLCIGSINGYPKCVVSRQKVFNFIEENM
jgi:hypothetical protein